MEDLLVGVFAALIAAGPGFDDDLLYLLALAEGLADDRLRQIQGGQTIQIGPQLVHGITSRTKSVA